MPRLSVWFVRASLVYLLLGITLGGLMLADEGMPFYPALGDVLPVHIEFLLAGWLIQLAMGVAYWILPRFASGPPRGSERVAWFSFSLFNAGILLVAVTSLFPHGWTGLAARLMEIVAAALFVFATWKRVKPSGK